ncbi:MAG TPA: SPOR domain-containing protein [Nevskiaceae bacterium]|nr:SPOR domain-containing protein [Nevskiaceae bacterium]
MAKRLLGLLVIVVVVLIVLAVLPKRGAHPAPGAVSVVAVPVGQAKVAAGAAPRVPVAGSSAVGASGTGASGAVAPAAAHSSAPPAATAPTSRQRVRSAVMQAAATAARPGGTSHEREPRKQSARVQPTRPSVTAAPRVPSAERQAKATPKPAAVAGPGYYVQIASFTDASKASGVLARLRRQGYSGALSDARVRGHLWHRVRVGPYADRAAAQAAQRRLAGLGYRNSRMVAP